MRIALLLLAACLSLGGCATIKGWFVSTPEQVPAEPAALAIPVPPTEAPEEPTPAPAAPVSPPRAVPPAPEPSRPRAPVPPRPASAAPAPPAPAAPRVTPDPAPQPPVLSPVLSAVDEQKLRADTQSRIDGVARRLRQIDPTKLASAEQENLQTVQSFLDKAREALQAQDVQRAFILADKAYLLADELTKR